VLVYTLHHGLTKGALFLTIAVPGSAAAARTQRLWSLAATAALGLSLAGMTLTSGAVAKASLKAAIVASGAPSAAGIVSALSLAAVGTTLLMARVWWLAARSGQAVGAGSPRVVPSPPPGEVPVAAWAIATALALAAPWVLMGGLAGAAHAWSLSGMAYILAGLALSGIAARLTARGLWRWTPEVPAGDILVPLERAASLLRTFTTAEPASHGHSHREERVEASAAAAAVPALPIVEQALLNWPVYGLVVLALLVATASVLVLGAG
jgi:hypothetical protein